MFQLDRNVTPDAPTTAPRDFVGAVMEKPQLGLAGRKAASVAQDWRRTELPILLLRDDHRFLQLRA
jgi:hypothetical protein